MSEIYHGSCHCGSVEFDISSEPIGVGNCHCRACQKATGAAYFTEAVFAESSVTIRGKLSEHASLADSGSTAYRGFCATCGSLIVGYGGSSGTVAIAVSARRNSGLLDPFPSIRALSAICHHWLVRSSREPHSIVRVRPNPGKTRGLRACSSYPIGSSRSYRSFQSAVVVGGRWA
jgi:hypothetical protein